MSPTAIGIIRISGPDAVAVADRVFRGKDEKKLAAHASYTIHYGWVVEDGETLDEVLALLMRGPHSYTAEDVVEIHCHGGVFVLQRILACVLKNGAKPAEPGEFTKRAFLAGRIDLSQAEAVADLLSSRNIYALQSSTRQLRGDLSQGINSIRAEVLHELAAIEAALDDPDAYDMDGYSNGLALKVGEWQRRIRKLVDSFRTGKLLKEGINTVIAGKPNTGKSSVMNLLLGQERSIVTEVPGTTRDLIEEGIYLDGMSLVLSDTAGLRDTKDLVEGLGIEKAKEALAKADLILLVLDASMPLDEDDRAAIELVGGSKVPGKGIAADDGIAADEGKAAGEGEAAGECIAADEGEAVGECKAAGECEASGVNKVGGVSKVGGASKVVLLANKVDLGPPVWDTKDLEKQTGYPVVLFSAKERTGGEELVGVVRQLFYSGEVTFNDQVYVTNIRQHRLLCEAGDCLDKVKQSIEQGMPEDFFAIDLMGCYENLGQVVGESVEEDLIDEIFSKFCMGK
jgi:tRNA modification GTPase